MVQLFSHLAIGALTAGALLACDDATDAAPTPQPVDATVDAARPDAAPDAAPQDAAPDAAPLDAAIPDAAPPVGGVDREAKVFVPSGEPPANGWPIVLVLHGFRANPELTVNQFPFGRTADQNGWIVVYPRGLEDENGFLHWDDFGRVPEGPGADVDHLLTVIDTVAARHRGDVDRVLVIGHSNGGAMAVQLACHVPERFQAFVNLSGRNIEDGRCAPSRIITGVWAHGTADGSVSYDGGADWPGVEAASARWADAAGCEGFDDLPEPVADMAVSPAGALTFVRRWTACGAGIRVERWRMQDVPHVLITTDTFSAAVRALLP